MPPRYFPPHKVSFDAELFASPKPPPPSRRHHDEAVSALPKPQTWLVMHGLWRGNGRVRVAHWGCHDGAALDDAIGLTPKNAGDHSTRSASLPFSTEPISFDTPCAIAGFGVFAM